MNEGERDILAIAMEPMPGGRRLGMSCRGPTSGGHAAFGLEIKIRDPGLAGPEIA